MGKRVFIIDDDKELCEELCETLKAEGFACDFAFYPSEAKEALLRNTYDILILDYKMPETDGITFLREIKEEARGLKIFIISGSLAIENLVAENGLSESVAGILNKPFDIEKLLAELKR